MSATGLPRHETGCRLPSGRAFQNASFPTRSGSEVMCRRSPGRGNSGPPAAHRQAITCSCRIPQGCTIQYPCITGRRVDDPSPIIQLCCGLRAAGVKPPSAAPNGGSRSFCACYDWFVKPGAVSVRQWLIPLVSRAVVSGRPARGRGYPTPPCRRPPSSLSAWVGGHGPRTRVGQHSAGDGTMSACRAGWSAARAGASCRNWHDRVPFACARRGIDGVGRPTC